MSFNAELKNLLNIHSKENESNTPDFLLMEYLVNCLELYENSIKKRDDWWGLMLSPGQASIREYERETNL